MNKGNKGHRQLVITGGYPAKHFQFIEETLHQMPLFVGVKVAIPRIGTVIPRRDGRDGVDSVLLRDIIPDLLCTIGLATESIASENLDTRE